jgi:hypothetical protein
MLWRLIALALEEDLHLMTIGVGKAVGRAVADVAVRPADSESTRDFRTGGASRDSLTESTVGSHTVRAPSRAATSTARGFRPPTAWLRTIAPKQWKPGTAALTTEARSAVAL